MTKETLPNASTSLFSQIENKSSLSENQNSSSTQLTSTEAAAAQIEKPQFTPSNSTGQNNQIKPTQIMDIEAKYDEKDQIKNQINSTTQMEINSPTNSKLKPFPEKSVRFLISSIDLFYFYFIFILFLFYFYFIFIFIFIFILFLFSLFLFYFYFVLFFFFFYFILFYSI